MKNYILIGIIFGIILISGWVFYSYLLSRSHGASDVIVIPNDNVLIEAIVLSANGTNVNVEIDKILEYERDPKATWEQLKKNDQISVSISIAKLVPIEEKTTDSESWKCEGSACYGKISPRSNVNLTELYELTSEEKISEFVSSLVGERIIISISCSALPPNYSFGCKGTVREII